MIKSKIAENYTSGTTEENGVLFIDTNMTSFLNLSNGIVSYLNIGVIITHEADEVTPEYVQYKILNTRVLRYTQEELKASIEATGENFNSPITNLMIDEINRFSNSMILQDIALNPQNYFGLSLDKWELCV